MAITRRHHPLTLTVAAAAAAGLVLAAPPSAALAARGAVGHATAGTSTSFRELRPLQGKVDGRTGAELQADSFVPDYVGGDLSGDPCLRLGAHGRVVSLPSSPVEPCHLATGEPVVALVGAACSDVEDPPFFAVGEAAQGACARDFNAAVIISVTVSVDGGPPVELTQPQFALSSAQRAVVIPADNPNGFPVGPATFTAQGWGAVLDSLPSGIHTVRAVGVFVGQDEPQILDVTLVVTPPGHR